MSEGAQKTSEKARRIPEAVFGAFLFIGYLISAFAYDSVAYRVRDWLFVGPAISQASALEARGGELAALPILQEQIARNPRNPRLLWALGDIYTKMDSPVLARFYFQALARLDQSAVNPLGANAIDSTLRDFAKPYQGYGRQIGAVMEVTRDVKETRDAYYQLKGAAPLINPPSFNTMLNTPAANLGVSDGYFHPDAFSNCPEDGDPCNSSGILAAGRLWEAIGSQKLVASLHERGADCCSLALDDPDLRSLSIVESEFDDRLEKAGDGFISSDLMRTRARLAFRARVLAKQLFVLGFADDAKGDVPEQGWTLWSVLGLIVWIVFAVALRAGVERLLALPGRRRRAKVEETAQPPPPPDAVPSSQADRVGILRRLGYGALAILLCWMALGWLVDSMRALPDVHELSLSGGTVSEMAVLKPSANGIDFAVGLSLLLAALLPLNQVFRRRRGPGPIDRFLGALSGRSGTRRWRILGTLVAIIAFGAFADLFFLHTVVHWDAAGAAQSFKQGVDELSIEANGRVIHGTSLDGGTMHLAAFTPTLVRAFDRADIGIGMLKHPFEYPVPGMVPLILLATLCLAAFLRWRRGGTNPGGEPDRWAARGFLALGLVQLYIILWLTSAQKGVTIFQPDIVDPDWLGPAFFILVAQLALLASIHHRLTEPSLTAPQRWGWVGIYLATTFCILPWVYHYADAPLLAPAMLWLLLYFGLAATFWCLLMLSRPPRGQSA